jgi:hypothetical protein
MLGWYSGGGSAKEDIEDNLSTLRQRSRDLYMGVPIAKLFETKEYTNIDTTNTLIHYTCAGRMFLEVVSIHFEFISTLANGKNSPALFCKGSFINNNKIYVEIINNVFCLVEDCCNVLSELHSKIKKIKNISEEDYLNSCFIATIKKEENREVVSSDKQLYADRVINAHIGYLDRFRLYVLSGDWVENKVEFNTNVCNFIEKYVDLMSKILIMPKTKETLLPYYIAQLEKIKNNRYKDFVSAIKKNL